MNFLIVDDDALAREVLAQTLAPLSAGDPAHLADSARAAMDALERGYLADLVICDVRMPDASGIDFVDGLRQDLRFNALPTMLITASPEQAVVRQAMQLRVQGFILKPAGADAVARVRTTLARFHAVLVEDLHDVCKRLPCMPSQYWAAVAALLDKVSLLPPWCAGERAQSATPTPDLALCLQGARLLGLRLLLKSLQSLERLTRKDTDSNDVRYREMGQELALQLQWLRSYRAWHLVDTRLPVGAPSGSSEANPATSFARIPPVHT